MGNDGGSIPKRSELVKQKAKKEKFDPELVSATLWFYCYLSKLPLALPIVTDEFGKLYNRQAILEYLLDKDSTVYGDADKICSHIKSIKNVKTLNLTVNPEYTKKAKQVNHGQVSQFMCPILQKEMNGRSRFVALWPCGCVMSEEAIKSMGSDSCLNCNKKYSQQDLIIINPSATELDLMKKNILARKEIEKKLKSEKKSKTKPLETKTVDERNSLDLTPLDNVSLNPGANKRVPDLDNPKKQLYLEHREKRLKLQKTQPNNANISSESGFSAAKIIEKYSNTTSANTKMLNSIFMTEADKKKQADNKNMLFKGTFNRYVA
ncbi:hypothetical protein BB561_001888 [Smittium simulii]|uniref:Uncharacterized protein n=1 Tax=Smittium simulii TaxID=133385 RepID=A0A2T9YSM0_9FUNG|nr:hypothetical protein BB561_001888 [Smittium simulii]